MRQSGATKSAAAAQHPLIASLTSLRFVAAMLVVVYHYFALGISGSSGKNVDVVQGPISKFLREYLPGLQYGHLAVDYFFVLSGFVLAHVYYQDVINGAFRYGHFLKKRLARIYPLHLVTLLFCASLAVMAWQLRVPINHPEAFAPDAFLPNVLLLQAFGVLHCLTFNGPSWSISAEWFAYVLFPLLLSIVLYRGLNSRAALIGTVAAFLCVYYYPSTDQLLTQRTYDFGILRIAMEFPIGLALYRVYNEYRLSDSRWVTPAYPIFVGVLIALGLQLQVEEAVTVLLFVVLIFVCTTAELNYPLKWLTHPWLVLGGTISYSIYMIHVPFVAVTRRGFRRLGVAPDSMTNDVLTLGCLVLVVLLSYFSYRWIERPMYRWTMNLFTRSAKPSTSNA